MSDDSRGFDRNCKKLVNKMPFIKTHKTNQMVTQNTLGQNNKEHKPGALKENLRKVSSTAEHPFPSSTIETDNQMTPAIKEIRGAIEKNIKENEKKRVARYQLPECRYQLPQCESNEKKVEYFNNIVNYAAMILESVEGKSDSQKLGKWTKDLQSDFLKLKTAFEKSGDQQNSFDILRKNKKLTQSLQGTIREIVYDLANHNKQEDKSILNIFMEKNTYLNSDEIKKHVVLDKHEFRQLKNHVVSFSSLDTADLINCQDIYKALSQDLAYYYKLKDGKNTTPDSKGIPHDGNTNPTELVRPPVEERGHQSTHVHYHYHDNNYYNYYNDKQHQIAELNQTPKISQQTQTNDDNNDDDSTVQSSGVGMHVSRPQISDLMVVQTLTDENKMESGTPINANKHTKTNTFEETRTVTTQGGAKRLLAPTTHTQLPDTWTSHENTWDFSRNWKKKN